MSLIVFGEAGPVLDGDRRLAMETKAAADPYGRCDDFSLGISPRKLAHRPHVGSSFVVQQRRILTERRLGIGHGFQRLVSDLGPVARILRDVSVLGQDGGDGFADIADLFARQRVEGCRVVIFQP